MCTSAAAAGLSSRSGPPGRLALFLRSLRTGDQIAHLIVLVFAASIFLVTVLLFFELFKGSALPRHKFGFLFFATRVWDPVAEQFGALPFIYGTLVTSILALVIAVQLGVGATV